MPSRIFQKKLLLSNMNQWGSFVYDALRLNFSLEKDVFKEFLSSED